MFKLHKMKDSFKVISSVVGVDSEGTLDEMKEVMRSLRASDGEIALGLRWMAELGHNTADFGLNLDTGDSSFIYSGNFILEYRNRAPEAVFTVVPDAVGEFTSYYR